MIVEALDGYAKSTGRWLQTWNVANAASIASVRLAFGQWELATLTARFMTERVPDYDGRIELGRSERTGEPRPDTAH